MSSKNFKYLSNFLYSQKNVRGEKEETLKNDIKLDNRVIKYRDKYSTPTINKISPTYIEI